MLMMEFIFHSYSHALGDLPISAKMESYLLEVYHILMDAWIPLFNGYTFRTINRDLEIDKFHNNGIIFMLHWVRMERRKLDYLRCVVLMLLLSVIFVLFFSFALYNIYLLFVLFLFADWMMVLYNLLFRRW